MSRGKARATTRVVAERVRRLNHDEPRSKGQYVLYWMQQSHRAEHNPALEYAVQQANEHDRRLLVVFGLMDDYPEANLRHYRFMVEGLTDVAEALADRNIKFVVQQGHPADVALRLSRRATVVVCDRGYLRHQESWRRRVADEAGCEVVQVEGDVVVPVEEVTDKREYAARTIRPKIQRQISRHLVGLRATPLGKDSTGLGVPGLDASRPGRLLDRLELDRSVAPNPLFRGGTREARRLLRRFLEGRFARYDANRGHPETDDVSHMGRYLHFGQVSPVWLALRIRDAAQGHKADREGYLEELVVRRELAQNFCAFEPDYDRYSALPDWAKRTLAAHRDDPRPHRYSRRQLEAARTHDPYWNAAMREMRYTGYVHNHMRMYWGKKILEWSNTPEQAYRVTLELNNRYLLDGRDPNSFANVAWVFGNHDRPWTERDVFGTVRYMSASGLERKCDIEAYVEKVDRLVDEVEAARADLV
jgi:deoxyribodipyrimidine photo-lyase